VFAKTGDGAFLGALGDLRVRRKSPAQRKSASYSFAFSCEVKGYQEKNDMENLSDQTVQRMAQFLTTEHFTLQGARNATIAEANGRLGHCLSTVGSGVVALAFVANVSSLGPVFLAFSAVIFPIMIVLGVVTLIRTIQIGVDFERLAQATNRIRHFYIEIAPEAEPYFSFPRFDDPEAVRQSMMPFHFRLQGLASTPGPVILINSVLVAAFAGILAVGFFSAGFGLAVLIAFLALGVGFVLHMLYSRQLWMEGERHLEVRFPSLQE
jgi:hypothetical protein